MARIGKLLQNSEDGQCRLQRPITSQSQKIFSCCPLCGLPLGITQRLHRCTRTCCWRKTFASSSRRFLSCCPYSLLQKSMPPACFANWRQTQRGHSGPCCSSSAFRFSSSALRAISSCSQVMRANFHRRSFCHNVLVALPVFPALLLCLLRHRSQHQRINLN